MASLNVDFMCSSRISLNRDLSVIFKHSENRRHIWWWVDIISAKVTQTPLDVTLVDEDTNSIPTDESMEQSLKLAV